MNTNILCPQAEAKFGYFLEAMDMGAPPHGNEHATITQTFLLFCNSLFISTEKAFPVLNLVIKRFTL